VKNMANDCVDNHLIHNHTYNTESDVALAHQHMILGASGPARTTAKSHVHRIRIRTSFLVDGTTGGHWHWVDIMTAEATDMPDGTHVHYYGGSTSYDLAHEHTFSGCTDTGPGDPPDDDEDDPPPYHNKYKHGKRPEDEEDD
jgi:hypothetical protein